MRDNEPVLVHARSAASSPSIVAAVIWLFATGCEPASVSPSTPGARTQAIYGGRPAPDDHAVFFLSTGCTASLIAPRTLLTAAHCVDGRPSFATNALLAEEGTRWSVVRSQSFTGTPADWSPDLGLVLLAQAPPVTPLRWQATGPLPPVGTLVRHVGYGLTETGSVGERRTVELPITGAGAPRDFGISLITGGNGVSICNGDSGGPALVRDAMGEVILGVHSYGYVCGGASGSALVYPYRRFVEDWLAQYEPASCARDTRCVAGCTPADLDCTCGADGVCGATCVDGDDPDCPSVCRPDGVCAPLTQCPVDLDCLPLGTRCLREAQCASRLCLADPQNPTRYCSAPCSAQSPCPAEFQCEAARGVCLKRQRTVLPEGSACAPGDTCADGLRCAADGPPPARCLKACSSNLECLGATRCDFASGVCVAQQALRLDAGTSWTGPLADIGGCNASGAPAWLLGVLLWWRRRR